MEWWSFGVLDRAPRRPQADRALAFGQNRFRVFRGLGRAKGVMEWRSFGVLDRAPRRPQAPWGLAFGRNRFRVFRVFRG